MKLRKHYKVGDKVMLILMGAQMYITDGLKQYDGQTFRVSKAKTMKQRGTCNYWTFYELKGCESQAGKPYTVIEDWLFDTNTWK